MHAAANHGCYDIAQMLVVDFGIDPLEEAGSGGGIGGKTAYQICEKHDDKCDSELWLKVIEEAVEAREAGEKTAMPLITKRKMAPKKATRKRAPKEEEVKLLLTSEDTEEGASARAEVRANDKKLTPAERKKAMEA